MSENWLTYQEAGNQLGMSAEAVRHRARRLGWGLQKQNDGKMKVVIPADLQPRPAHVHPIIRSTVERPNTSSTINELRDHVATLRDALAKADARVERADAGADHARHVAERDRDAAAADRAAAHADRTALEMLIQAMRAELDTLHALAATAPHRGLWARLTGR